MDNSILFKGIVDSVDDSQWTEKIKVRLNSKPKGDLIIGDENTYDALPLLPMIAHIKPKVGEAVYVLIPEVDGFNKESLKYYIGPIISQPNHMYEEPSILAMASDDSSTIAPEINPGLAPNKDNNINSCFAQNDDVALYGRKDSEIILGDGSAIMRTDARHYNYGVDKNGNHYSNNDETPSFVLLKKDDGQTYKIDDSGNTNSIGSTATIVADNINLIANVGDGAYHPSSSDENTLVSQKKMAEIMEKAHRLPYGDVLVDFLTEFVDVFMHHYHRYPGLTPDETNGVKGLQTRTETLERDMLTKHVRIN